VETAADRIGFFSPRRRQQDIECHIRAAAEDRAWRFWTTLFISPSLPADDILTPLPASSRSVLSTSFSSVAGRRHLRPRVAPRR